MRRLIDASDSIAGARDRFTGIVEHQTNAMVSNDIRHFARLLQPE